MDFKKLTQSVPDKKEYVKTKTVCFNVEQADYDKFIKICNHSGKLRSAILRALMLEYIKENY